MISMFSMKGQSAIEYLMTYGWMLLVVAIVGGAIFTVVGDQNLESFSGLNGADVSVENFGVDSHGRIIFELRNTASDSIELNRVTISNSGKERTYPVNKTVSVSESGLVYLPDLSQSSGSNSMDVNIVYSTEKLDNLVIDGEVTSSYQLDDSWSNMVGYFPLDEKDGDTAHDYTNNIPDGSIDENVTLNREGVTGESYYFNDTHVTISDNEVLDPGTEELTVTSWVRYNGTYDWARILSKARWGSLDDANGWHIQKWKQNISFVVSDGNSHGRIVADNIDDGEWHFVAGRWNGTHLKMEVDDESYGPVKYLNSDPIENNYPLVMGASAAPDKQDYFHGNVDEVRIYNRCLSDTELKEIREKGS